jgi:hypothetical protein
MDVVVSELLKMGGAGVIAAVLLLVGRAVAPSIAGLLPAFVSARAQREERLIAALEASTKVMAETVTTLQSLRSEVGDIRDAYGDLRVDVGLIAERLDMPRRGRERRLTTETVEPPRRQERQGS